MSGTRLKKKSTSDNKLQPAANDKLNKLARKSSDEKPLQKKPYIQTKLSVSTPGDSHEQEADRVADEVVSRSAANNASSTNTVVPGSSQPEKTLGNAQSLQTKISRVPEESIAKMDDETESVSDTSPDTESTSSESENTVSADVEQQIESLKGNGSQLSDDVRSEMESQFSHDFSSVCIHNDAAADALCKQLSARAFTVGNDIFFASGEYAPTTQEGKRLLAHELTHVVQQGKGVTRQVMRAAQPDSANPGQFIDTQSGINYRFDPSATPKKLTISDVKIPQFKMDRHAGLYQGRSLFVRKGPRATSQREVWINYFSSNAIQNMGVFANLPAEEIKFFKSNKVNNFYLFGNTSELQPKFVRPFWDSNHHPRTFEVDHRLEDQLGGNSAGTGQLPEIDNDQLNNYELLERGANGASGRALDGHINDRLTTAITSFSAQGISSSVRHIRSNYIVEFTGVTADGASYENSSAYWLSDNIKTGQHLQDFELLVGAGETPEGIPAPTASVKLFLSQTGGNPKDAPRQPNARVEIYERLFSTGPIQFSADGNSAVIPAEAFRASQDSPSAKAAYPNIDLTFERIRLPVPSAEGHFYRILRDPTLNSARRGTFQSLSIPGFSPIQIDNLDLDPVLGFIGGGKLLPSVPLFANADIDVLVLGGEVRIQKTFSLDEISVPSPFHVDDASVTLFISSTGGLGIEGNVGITIEHIGKCNINAELSTSNGLLLQGRFNFDEGLFNGIDASVEASFHRQNIFDEADHGHWSMGGQVVIPRGKISGIETATVNLSYSDQEGFSAHGEATLSVPGVENGTIDITHNEEEGMVIAGQFNLRQGRGIRGGQISARVQEKPDGSGYAVTAHGEAQPDIPGINSNLIVDYNDGAFTAEVTADYSRGMLSGQIHAGVTNRTVNEDGTLAETPSENNELVVFGDGQLTIRIAPWLQGTAGVRFAPNGEITVIGEIGLPDQLEIFARREINRSIFSIAVQAPIFPGIVAEVGGGLSATAGIGPGVIDQLVLRVEYNPAREEDTHVTGDAHLNIPANAGLRLNVRAGIGLGITGASATGGLDIGGTLGIEGAAEAGVHVDWTPATGLDITAELAVHAQPSFTFDIGGYVSVRALGFEVYDNRWQFASYTFGSDYRFGIRLPIHYHEGEPFDISTDDIEFEVPDIDTNQLLRGLIARIA